MDIYSKLRRRAMNWSAIVVPILALAFNSVISIGLLHTNEGAKKKIIHVLSWKFTLSSVLYLAIIGLFLVSSLSIYQHEVDAENGGMKSSETGVLQSSSVWPFSTYQNKYPYLEIGNSGVILNWTGPNNQSVLRIFDSPISISNDDGQIKISANLIGPDGSSSVLDNNEWFINLAHMTRNYNKDTLEVYDENHDVILQIRLLKDRIQFQGKIYDKKGNGVAIVGRKSWQGAIFEQTGSVHRKLNSTIQPIFGLGFGKVRSLPEDSPRFLDFNISQSLILGKNQEGNKVFIDAIPKQSSAPIREIPGLPDIDFIVYKSTYNDKEPDGIVYAVDNIKKIVFLNNGSVVGLTPSWASSPF